MFDRPSRHCPVHADGRSRRRGDQNRGAGRGRQLARRVGAARYAEHVLRDEQPRRKERHAEPEGAGGTRDPEETRGPSRHLWPELSPRRRREERLWLGGAAQGQPEARLHVYLGLWAQGAARKPARHRLHGPGARRHCLGLRDTRPAHEDRRRFCCRRDLRHTRLRRCARCVDPRARHRRRPEDRLLAARRPDPTDGLDF